MSCCSSRWALVPPAAMSLMCHANEQIWQWRWSLNRKSLSGTLRGLSELSAEPPPQSPCCRKGILSHSETPWHNRKHSIKSSLSPPVWPCGNIPKSSSSPSGLCTHPSVRPGDFGLMPIQVIVCQSEPLEVPWMGRGRVSLHYPGFYLASSQGLGLA